MRSSYIIYIILVFHFSCTNSETKLFEKLTSFKTGIDFENNLTFKEDFNIFTYRNYYNGGGVGLGDINNDGLLDIYFTSNLNQNKLYLNKGDFQFEDTTGELDNLENTKSWCVAGGLRINNFKTIRENENYIVATHDVIQEGSPKSNVLVYAEQTNGKFTYWKIQRAFEV